MLKKFRTQPDYLAQYHLYYCFSLCVAIALLGYFSPPSWQDILWYLPAVYFLTSPKIQVVTISLMYAVVITVMDQRFQSSYLLALPLAVLLTFPFTALIHSASHDSIKPRWVNRFIGETMGMFQLFGFADWKVIHVIHHTHTDDPELDPHPPMNKGYWEFTKGVRDTASSAYVKYYMKYFGQTPESMKSLKRFALASKADTLLRTIFWFMFLGPQLFTFLFMSSIVFKMFHYAWLNYSTHRPDEQGTVIRNLDNHIYKFINAVAFGLYYHGNHHLAPGLFDPRKLSAKRQKNIRTESPLNKAG